MSQYVLISFECLPLRSVGRLDIPIDASPSFRARCGRIKHALEKHGAHNSYFLYDASCTFHLTNNPVRGMLQYAFEGTVLTDGADQKCMACDLEISLDQETCQWLTEPVASWFRETVREAVWAEFDRFIATGDLEKTKQRAQRIEANCEHSGGFLGMYL